MPLRLLFFVCFLPVYAHDHMSAQLNVDRSDQLTITYHFEKPINSLVLGPKILNYREVAWTIETPGLSLAYEPGGDEYITGEQPFQECVIQVARFDGIAFDKYAPQLNFSNGDLGIFLGHFMGKARIDDHHWIINYQIDLSGSEPHILSKMANKGERTYAYFGSLTSEQKSFGTVIVDPSLPAWFQKVAMETSQVMIEYYSKTFGPLPFKPFILIAGDVERDDFSMKGSVIADQIVYNISGKVLKEFKPHFKPYFERLVSHEIAHFWQYQYCQRYGEAETWISEGGADILAVHALLDQGLWDQKLVDNYSNDHLQHLQKATKDKSFHQAVKADYMLNYAYGYHLFLDLKVDQIQLWKKLFSSSLPFREESVRAIAKDLEL